MTDPVTYVRAEDLLDDSPPRKLVRTFRLSRRRQLTGLALAVLVLPLVTLLLDLFNPELDLDAQVLIYLLAVVGIAIVGGIVVAAGSAVASALLLNYFFVEPVHTLTIHETDQLVALVVFVAVACIVSGAVELAVLRAQAAERARAEAETVSSLAGPDLSGDGSVRAILEQARETFKMESVTLKVRRHGTEEWQDIEHAGWAPPGGEAPLRFDVPAGDSVRIAGRGPALFAEDRRVLDAFAAAAATAYEGSVLTEEAKEARTLASVDRQRTALLAAVGHDLRTPLAGIKAAATSLSQSDVEWSEAERRELVGAIEESTERLESVVENLLDASRLEAGALSVNTEPVALDETVAAALLALGDGANGVQVDVPEDLPLVEADGGLLQRVLVNVIDNAVRHGASDQPIRVHAHAGSGSARLEVVDHGTGVSEAQRSRLFEPFQRAGERGDGLGLGLSVSRGFVEAMGGAMVADATKGGGLTMRLRLPLAGTMAEPA